MKLVLGMVPVAMKAKWRPPEPLLVLSEKGHQQLHRLLLRLPSLLPALYPRYALDRKKKCGRGRRRFCPVRPSPLSRRGIPPSGCTFLLAPQNVPATVRMTNVFLVWVAVVAPMLVSLFDVLLRPQRRVVMPPFVLMQAWQRGFPECTHDYMEVVRKMPKRAVKQTRDCEPPKAIKLNIESPSLPKSCTKLCHQEAGAVLEGIESGRPCNYVQSRT